MLHKVLLCFSLSTLALCTSLPEIPKLFGDETKPSNDIKYGPTLLYPNKNNIDPQQCFCMPKSTENKNVLTLLNTQYSTVERLVVYFYKVDGSLKVYIPNVEKQYLIPDLSYANGDILRNVWSLEPIDQLYDTCPNVINWYLRPYSPDNFKDDTHININLNEENAIQVPESSPWKNVFRPPKGIDGQKPGQITGNEQTYPTVPTNELDATDEHKGNVSPGNNLIIDMPHNNPSIIDQIFTPSDQNSPYFNVDVQQLLKYPPIIPSNLNPDQQRQILLLNKVPSAFVNGWLQKQKFYSPDHTIVDGSVTFDKWFRDQLTLVLSENLEISTTPNFFNLKVRIQEVLQKIGMYISPEGILYDSYGNELKMSNLSLRPILIGDAVAYENLIKQQISSKYSYVLPTDITYLQAILVTLVKPPKVLGIVALGKIVLPRQLKAANKLDILQNYDQITSTSGLEHISPCKTCKLNQFKLNAADEISNDEIPVIYYKSGAKEHSNEEKPKTALPKFTRLLPRKQKKGSIEMNKANDKKIIKKILTLFEPDPSEKQTRRLNEDKVVFLPEPDEREKYLNEDQPGYRIIGGSAATGSGPPLSSRGRSGVVIPKTQV